MAWKVIIMEFKGSTTCWTNTYKNENGQWSSVGTTISSPVSWHTYTAYLTRIEILTNNVSIEYWIDGSNVSTQTGQSFVNQPLNLIIDLQMEGSSGTTWANRKHGYEREKRPASKEATL